MWLMMSSHLMADPTTFYCVVWCTERLQFIAFRPDSSREDRRHLHCDWRRQLWTAISSTGSDNFKSSRRVSFFVAAV